MSGNDSERISEEKRASDLVAEDRAKNFAEANTEAILTDAKIWT